MITLSRIDIQRMNKGQGNAPGGSSGEAGGGNGIQVQESGTGNAYTSNTYESGILNLNKGKTFVDTDTDQTIGGTKTFTDRVIAPDFRGQVSTSSDIRKKNVLDNISLSVEEMAQLSSILFRYKEDDGHVHGGVIAQEVQTVAPWAVREDEDGFLLVDYQALASVAFISCAREIVELKNIINELKATK